jgi:lipopolysaccharide transport system permease protein
VWRYRELLYFFVWRDIKVRYRQTALGVAWAVVQPLATMAVFAVVMGRFMGVPSDGVPYPVFAFAALIPWSFFAGGLGAAANSVVGSANLVRKIYFPKLLVPAASVIGGVVDLMLTLGVLGALMAWYGVMPTWRLVALPAMLALALVTALGVGLCLAVVNVHFRDVQYTIPFLILFWFFATPVAYPMSLAPEGWRMLLGLNPMAGVVEGFRWALLGTPGPSPGVLLASSLVAAAFLLTGLVAFRHFEGKFADVV